MPKSKRELPDRLHLKSITARQSPGAPDNGFPFNLPILKSLETLDFSAPVTFFVGENGSGKSTLLEAIACAAGSITVGSESVKTDPSLAAVRKYAAQLRLAWQKRTHRGFFLRAEDFFGFARRQAQIRQELEADRDAVDREYQGRSQAAIDYGKMAYSSELHAMARRYGEGLDNYSHGESFLTLFQARFVPDGLYLLDEPETPLSPLRQLAFISALKRMVEQDGQFIIATHSPILMAYPGATLLSFESDRIHPVGYEDLEHVRITRDFLNDPEAFLNHL